ATHSPAQGTLTDGTVFDTNMEKRAPALQFKVGMGKVIRGWDDALLDMKVGEQAKLTIPAEAAYGKKVRVCVNAPHTNSITQGIAGKIPPNSTLIFGVELIN